MARYALILDGLVNQFLETDGDITTMFPPVLVWVNVAPWPGVEVGWIAEQINGEWNLRPWSPSPEYILHLNQLTKEYKRSISIQPMAMSLLNSKLCYYDESGNTPLAKQWQQYWADLDATDLTVETPAWPTPPSGTPV